jgi:uncharacterized membrane protein
MSILLEPKDHTRKPKPQSPEPRAESRAPGTTRLQSVDLLRGLVMIVMVLDHVRDYVHKDGLFGDPTNLTTTTFALFMTRWVTHYCAPVFIFLAGVGAYLQRARGTTPRELSRFLWTRGVWLIVLEFTVIRITTWFNVDYTFLGVLQVIWTLGICMIVLAALIHLPLRVIAGFGIAMVLVHNAFDWVHVDGWKGPGSPVPGAWGVVWILLHQTTELLPVFGGPVVFVIYPLVPWIGVMAAGYALGHVYTFEASRRQRWLLRIGVGLVVGFVLLRATNLYGDPSMWSTQRNTLLTVLSFINVTKYPASLLFVMMTLGPALIALAWFERLGRSSVTSAIARVGRVPLFFYLLQWPLAHSAGLIASAVAGRDTAHYFMNPTALIGAPATNVGFDLPVVYLCWAAVIAVLIPLCLWYANVKQRHPSGWLRYL